MLVREASQHKVEEIRELLGADKEQLIPVVGDITQDYLGVDMEWIKENIGKIDHFYHLAAIYDLTADADSQYKTNVEGTAQAIALSKSLQSGCFHLVSSIAAAGLYKGTFTEEMFDEAVGLDNPYFRTKHDSEGLVRQQQDMTWRIYRPGMVVGHSETGQIDKIDGPYYFFKAIKNIGKTVPKAIPMLMSKAGRINIVPVDFVANALDHLSHLPEKDQQCFYLTDPKSVRVGDLIKTMLNIAGGPDITPLNLPLIDTATETTGKLIGKIAPVKMLTNKLVESVGIPSQVLSYLYFPTRYDNKATTELLSEAGIVCPPFETYAPTLWHYWNTVIETDNGPSVIEDMTKIFSEVVGLTSHKALRRSVKGKVVVITGSTSGIGKECAVTLAAVGAKVILVARTPEKLDETLNHIKQDGGKAYSYACDVSDMQQCDELVAKVLKDHGRVDILINNAGRSIRRSVRYSYDRFHDFERTMQLNYFGALRLITGFLPSMEENQSGQIINISSIGVLTTPPRFSAYVASKAALDAFSQCAAPEYTDQNINFTTIHMPLVRTPMIAPTSLYRAFPTLSPEEACGLVTKAIVDKPKKVSSALGISGAVAQATMPEFTEKLLARAYELFPDSAAARGLSEEEAAKERENVPTTKLEIARKMFTTVLRGGHW